MATPSELRYLLLKKILLCDLPSHFHPLLVRILESGRRTSPGVPGDHGVVTGGLGDVCAWLQLAAP